VDVRGSQYRYRVGQKTIKPEVRAYITYCNAARGGPSHGHGGSAYKISWRSVQLFQRYARGQTHRQTNWSQYSAPILGRSKYNRHPRQLYQTQQKYANGHWAVKEWHSLLSLSNYRLATTSPAIVQDASGINVAPHSESKWNGFRLLCSSAAKPQKIVAWQWHRVGWP